MQSGGIRGQAATAAMNSPSGGAVTNAGMANSGSGVSGPDKDTKDPSTDPHFGDVWKNIEAKYGAKQEKPREIKKTLGKDDFLRIMITQMKHQDPSQPFKADQMAQQMAQYASVEQLQNINTSIGKMATQGQPMERLAMTNLIGKTVTVDRERFPHIEGSKESLTYTMPKEAKTTKITITSETGEMVFEKDLGPQKAGSATFVWEGLKGNTLPAKGGGYLFQIDAKDDQGRTIQTNPQGQAKVVGVSFEGAEPVFLVGDPSKPDKVTMKNIVRIESEGSSNLIPGAKPISGGNANGDSQIKAPNMIAFKKGEGSANLDASQLRGDAAKALATYQGQTQASTQAPLQSPAQAQSAASPAKAGELSGAPAKVQAQNAQIAGQKSEEKGFPNGLHE